MNYYKKIISMKKVEKQLYEAPLTEIQDLEQEGAICITSGDNEDFGDGDDYGEGDFNA